MNQLKKYRLLAGLSQEDLASRVGVSQPTYQRWESEKSPVPPRKLNALCEALSVPSTILVGPHIPKPAQPYDEAVPEDWRYYGEIAFHFAGGGRPLLLSISESEHTELFRQLQDDSFYVVVTSLSNQRVAVRRSAITDVFLSSEAYDSFGPEDASYDRPPVLLADPRDWDVIEAFGDELGYDGDDPEIEARIEEILYPISGKEFERLLTEKVMSEEAVEESRLRQESRALRIIELAASASYQLSTGAIRRFTRFEDLYESFFTVFEHPYMEESPILIREEDGYHRSVFINPRNMDYICLPNHWWIDSVVADREMNHG